MNSFNSFETPEVVKPASFNGFTLRDGILTINMPSKSVVVLELVK
jgi:alpha-N-arabinofuranosidase